MAVYVVCVLPMGQDLTVIAEAKSGLCGVCRVQSGQGVLVPTEAKSGLIIFPRKNEAPTVIESLWAKIRVLAAFILDPGGLPCHVNALLRKFVRCLNCGFGGFALFPFRQSLYLPGLPQPPEH